MHLPPILFADVGTVIQIALVLLFIFGPVLFKLFGVAERQPDRTLPRRQPQQPRPEPQQPSSDVEEEIEDFLRRARGQRGGGAAADVEAVRPRHAGTQRPIQPQVDMEILDAEAVSEHRLESRIGSSIDTSDFEQRADRMGDQVEHADDAMEARLHATFDRDMGSLSGVGAKLATGDVSPAPEDDVTRAAEARAATAAAHRLLARLRSSQGVRDAIVLREILERPDHRW